MPTLNVSDLVKSMTKAAVGSLKDSWPGIKDLASSSLKSLATTLVDIERLTKDAAITHDQASLLVTMQKNTLNIVLLSEEGLGLIAVQDAINAIIAAVEAVVNAAIGFALL